MNLHILSFFFLVKTSLGFNLPSRTHTVAGIRNQLFKQRTKQFGLRNIISASNNILPPAVLFQLNAEKEIIDAGADGEDVKISSAAIETKASSQSSSKITARKHSEFIAWAKGKWPDQFKEVQSMLRFPPLTVHTVPAGQRKTNTNRADHYFALKSMPKVGGVRTPPYWSKSYDPVKDAKGKTVGWRFNGKGKIVGNHTFERHR